MRPQSQPGFLRHQAKWHFKKLQTALDLALPRICELCKQYSNTDTHLCSFCYESLSPNSCPCLICAEPVDIQHPLGCYRCHSASFAFEQCIAPWLYSEEMRYLIRRWKFEGATHLTNTLCKLFLSETGTQTPDVDILVPTPLHWRRQLSRGFNQSKLIANALGRRLNLPVLESLKRQKYSTPQHKTRHRADRQLNEYHFIATQQLQGLRVALIDDVITTGSTANAASKSLLNAGADKVQLWCLARTPFTGTS